MYSLLVESMKFKCAIKGNCYSEHSQNGKIYATDGISPTLCNGEKRWGGLQPKIILNQNNMNKSNQTKLPKELEGRKFRIRKLTPRECFRLMDVDDNDIDKIQASGISNSAQYRLAGNSICVSVLFHILRKLIIEQGNENQQLELF